MKCLHCGSPTRVLETRVSDRGYTLRRVRKCLHGHKSETFEVVGPMYRAAPQQRRHSVLTACEARAFRAERNAQMLDDLKTMTTRAVADKHGVTHTFVVLVKRCGVAPHYRR